MKEEWLPNCVWELLEKVRDFSIAHVLKDDKTVIGMGHLGRETEWRGNCSDGPACYLSRNAKSVDVNSTMRKRKLRMNLVHFVVSCQNTNRS